MIAFFSLSLHFPACKTEVILAPNCEGPVINKGQCLSQGYSQFPMASGDGLLKDTKAWPPCLCEGLRRAMSTCCLLLVSLRLLLQLHPSSASPYSPSCLPQSSKRVCESTSPQKPLRVTFHLRSWSPGT